jgi:hypothetical protein
MAELTSVTARLLAEEMGYLRVAFFLSAGERVATFVAENQLPHSWTLVPAAKRSAELTSRSVTFRAPFTGGRVVHVEQ